MSSTPISCARSLRLLSDSCAIERAVTAGDINRMHLARGFREIGYHYFIRRDGTVETGRDLSQPGRFETGAHSQGENGESVGICYEGGVTLDDRTTGRDTRTPAQTAAMIGLIRDLLRRFPDAKVEGHRDMPFAATQCPGFDGAAWWASVVADAAGSGAGAVGPDPDRDVMPADDEVQRLRWRLAEIRDRAVAALDGL